MRPRDIIRRVVKRRPQYVVEALPNRHTIEEIAGNLPDTYEYLVEPIRYKRKESWHRLWALSPRVTPDSPRLPALYAVDLYFSLHRQLVRELVREDREPEWYKKHEPWVVEAEFSDLFAQDLEGLDFLAVLLDRLCRCQALGNVNHRTAVYLLEVLAAYVYVKLNRPAPGGGKNFAKDVDQFIARSKTVLKGLEDVFAPRQALLMRHLGYARELVEKSRQLQSMARATDCKAALEAFITDWGKLT